MRRAARIFRNLFRRTRVDRELSEEMSSYIEMLVARKIRDGASPEEARRMAMIEFGGVDQVKERVRDARLGRTLETLSQDLRYGFRTLRKSPGFTAIAVLTLGLGIGANSAIFSVVNAVLLRPLPFEDADKLVELRESFLSKGIDSEAVSPADFQYWRDNARSLSGIAAYYNWQSFNLTGTGDPERLNTSTVSTNFFRVLGVRPEAGRDFSDAEGAPGQNSVVVISHSLWKRRLAGDPAIVGRAISLDGESYTVVGVMPAAFKFPAAQTDIWTPIALSAEGLSSHGHFLDHTVARLTNGATLAQLRSEMDAIATRQAKLSPDSNKGCGVTVDSLAGTKVRGIRPALLLLFAAVGLVLMVACANIANLMLVRTA
ncbi:MAG: ABC transporter permease, partial [Blastocatellia bacterium]